MYIVYIPKSQRNIFSISTEYYISIHPIRDKEI